MKNTIILISALMVSSYAAEIKPAEVMREALKKLRTPVTENTEAKKLQAQWAGDAVLASYLLAQMADEQKGRGDLRAAEVLYSQALSGLSELQKLCPDYEPKIIKYRISFLEKSLPAKTNENPK
jgi:hypothetical protein